MITELYFLIFIKYNIASTLSTKQLIYFLFFIKLFNCLNFEVFNPINSAGNIPTSDKTEYLPPIKLL